MDPIYTVTRFHDHFTREVSRINGQNVITHYFDHNLMWFDILSRSLEIYFRTLSMSEFLKDYRVIIDELIMTDCLP